MGNTADDLVKEVIELEKYSLRNDVRFSKEKLNDILSDEFIEFGSSGTIYKKEDVLNELSFDDEQTFKILDLKAEPLGVDVVQLIYTLLNENSNTYSLRCSIWQWKLGKWEMIFHQGTKSADDQIKKFK